jgi:hypothetical protein
MPYIHVIHRQEHDAVAGQLQRSAVRFWPLAATSCYVDARTPMSANDPRRTSDNSADGEENNRGVARLKLTLA